MTTDKMIVIAGLADQRSFGYAIAKEALRRGYHVLGTCQVERALKNFDPNEFMIRVCDFTDPYDVKNLTNAIWDTCREMKLKAAVHSIAFSRALNAPIVRINEADFAETMLVSAYSLLTFVNAVFMGDPVSVLGLSYVGADRVVPGYGVMGVAKAAYEALGRQIAYEHPGIRVNFLRPAPMPTRAAKGIPAFATIRKVWEGLAMNDPAALTGEAIGRMALDMIENPALNGQSIDLDCGAYSRV
jgi:enoyl-[acyl-carrier protein] reductase I